MSDLFSSGKWVAPGAVRQVTLGKGTPGRLCPATVRYDGRTYQFDGVRADGHVMYSLMEPKS